MSISLLSNSESGASCRTSLNQAITAINEIQNSETTEFSSAITSAGGYVDDTTLAAVDDFISSGKSDGWWSLMVEVYPFVGNNLAASLVKLKKGTGLATSLVNNGMAETDYSQRDGMGPLDNASKYLQTGLIATNNGLTASNISLGGALLGDTAWSGSGFSFGTQNTTGEPVLVDVYNRACGITSSAYIAAAAGKCSLPYIPITSYNGTAFKGFLSGVNITNQTVSAPTGGGLDTEFYFFRVKRTGTIYYAGGKVGLHFVGSALTAAQGESLGLAIHEFERRVGRAVIESNPILGFVGDSITAGQGATSFSAAWTNIVQSGIGCSSTNVALPSATMFQPASGIVIQSVRDQIAQLSANTWIIMAGTNDYQFDPAANGTQADADLFQFYATLVANKLKANGKRVIMTSPEFRTTGAGGLTLAKGRMYATSAAAAAAAAGVEFIDIDLLFRNQTTPDDFMNVDGIHPNDAGHALMAEAILNAVRNGVSGPTSQSRVVTVSITLALTNQGNYIRLNDASTPIVVTVPTNASVAFPIDTEITLFSLGAAANTVAATGGVTINNAGLTITRYKAAVLKKVGADEWDLIGGLE